MVNLKKHIHNLMHTRERNALLHFICVCVFYMVIYGYRIWLGWDKVYGPCSLPEIMAPIFLTIIIAPIHLLILFCIKKIGWTGNQYLIGGAIVYALIICIFIALGFLANLIDLFYNKLPAIQSILYPLFVILSFEKV